MTPEISEFSYGFALTNEIVGWLPLAAAPLFPSLIEEGRAGGGYDVRLNAPGIALFLQFKRADCMTRRSAMEIRYHKKKISLPFYRFKITETGKSDQHNMLRVLDDGTNFVYYAAPRFHKLAEIDAAWATNTVASKSIFVAPNAIGRLDRKSHHYAYNETSAFLCSEPKRVDFLTAAQVLKKLQNRLEEEREPFLHRVPVLISKIKEAYERESRRAESNIYERRIVARTSSQGLQAPTESPSMQYSTSVPYEPIAKRSPEKLSDGKEQLRQLTDLSAKALNAQLVIVQKSE